jgi:hypothetical protein
MDEADYVCCALKRVQKRGSPDQIRCLHAAVPTNGANQTAKRSVTCVDGATGQTRTELDPDARLESGHYRIADATRTFVAKATSGRSAIGRRAGSKIRFCKQCLLDSYRPQQMGYVYGPNSFLAARRTDSSLTLPVVARISPSVTFGPN